MKFELLLSGINGLYLVRGNRCKQVRSGNYYGISWNDKKVFLGFRGIPMALAWHGGKEIEKLPFESRLDDNHQILWYDGRLYVTHTQKNRLEVLNGKETSIVQWLPDPPPDEHINSIWCDGSRFYVAEHRRGVQPARIRIFDINFKELNLIELPDLDHTHACGIHNVYVEDRILYTLSVNRLVLYDLDTGRIEKQRVLRSEKTSYLRGLARTKDYFFIGESKIAQRWDRNSGDGAVLVLGKKLNLIGSIPILDIGQIHEVRALKGDFAHNSLPCPVKFQ